MDEIRFNSPPQKAVAEQSQPKKNFKPLLKKVLKKFMMLVILAAVILFGFLGKDIFSGAFNPDSNQAKNEIYSAVFLTNGQVYFGKLIDNNEKDIVLNDVYYVQISQNATKEEIANSLNQNRFNLIKLGNELHGPTNELFINRSQVVFYEYLRDDSKVVEAIKNYK